MPTLSKKSASTMVVPVVSPWVQPWVREALGHAPNLASTLPTTLCKPGKLPWIHHTFYHW